MAWDSNNARALRSIWGLGLYVTDEGYVIKLLAHLQFLSCSFAITGSSAVDQDLVFSAL